MHNIAFAVAGALATSCLFPNHWAPWCDIDRLFRGVFNSVLSRSARDDAAGAEAWRRSYRDRIGLIKYAAWGLVLILLLPLNSLTASSWFVDEIWKWLEWVRHTLSDILGEKRIFDHVHNWRYAPYDLWEICVFLWVFPLLGNWIKHDYIRLAKARPADPSGNFETGTRVTWLLVIMSTCGAVFLVVLEAPRYRLLVELVVVGILAGADLAFCRLWLPLNRRKAIEHLEVFFIVDACAFAGFILLLLFFELTSHSYQAQWATPFVAGVSALNLVFANTAALVLRGIQRYREEDGGQEGQG